MQWKRYRTFLIASQQDRRKSWKCTRPGVKNNGFADRNICASHLAQPGCLPGWRWSSGCGARAAHVLTSNMEIISALHIYCQKGQ